MNIITKSLIISKTGLLDEYATQIEIDDLGGGEFVKITQPCAAGNEEISIDIEEWPAIRAQINKMVADIKQRKNNARHQSP
jgi:hypothetical protein